MTDRVREVVFRNRDHIISEDFTRRSISGERVRETNVSVTTDGHLHYDEDRQGRYACTWQELI